MNILFGHYTADAGEVRVDGKPLPPGKPRAAIAAGRGHGASAFHAGRQPDACWRTSSSGRNRSGGSTADRDRGAGADLQHLSGTFGLPVDPDARVGDLSVGERQRVEILKALYREARILILDEPTAVLARPEAEQLFAHLRGMTAGGLSIIFISHKLHEVMAASDRVVVLRGGKVVAERATAPTTPSELAELMVGRSVARPAPRGACGGQARAGGAGPDAWPKAAGAALDAVDFEVCEGEILGIVGVSGNGQASAGAGPVRALRGPMPGTLTFEGRDISRLTPRDLIRLGLGRVPEDRHAEGAVGDLSGLGKCGAGTAARPRFSRWGFVRRRGGAGPCRRADRAASTSAVRGPRRARGCCRAGTCKS